MVTSASTTPPTGPRAWPPSPTRPPNWRAPCAAPSRLPAPSPTGTPRCRTPPTPCSACDQASDGLRGAEDERGADDEREARDDRRRAVPVLAGKRGGEDDGHGGLQRECAGGHARRADALQGGHLVDEAEAGDRRGRQAPDDSAA